MKRFISAALAAALLAPGLMAGRARAQDDAPPPPPPPQDGGQPDAGQPGGAPPEGDHHDGDRRDGGRREEMIKRRLGLTDEQAAKLKDATKAHMEANKPFNEQLRTGMKTLRDQLRSKASDDDVQKTLDSLKSARKGMAEENEKFQATLASFLSPTQRAKLLVGMVNQMRNRRGGPGGDHRERDRRDGDRDGDDDRGGMPDDGQ